MLILRDGNNSQMLYKKCFINILFPVIVFFAVLFGPTLAHAEQTDMGGYRVNLNIIYDSDNVPSKIDIKDIKIYKTLAPSPDLLDDSEKSTAFAIETVDSSNKALYSFLFYPYLSEQLNSKQLQAGIAFNYHLPWNKLTSKIVIRRGTTIYATKNISKSENNKIIDNSYVIDTQSQQNEKGVTTVIINAKQDFTIKSDDGMITLFFPALSYKTDVLLMIENLDNAEINPGDNKTISANYRISANDLDGNLITELEKPMTVSFDKGYLKNMKLETAKITRYTDNKSTDLNTEFKGNKLSTSTKSLGVYYVTADKDDSTIIYLVIGIIIAIVAILSLGGLYLYNKRKAYRQ